MDPLHIFKQHCLPEWIPVLEFHQKILEFKAKSNIFNIGDPVEGIYFIQKGHVKVVSNFHGEQRIIRLAGDGMILGHRGLHRSHYSITATCITNTILTFIPLHLFLSVTTANPAFSAYLINFLSDELNEAEERMSNILLLDPRKKISLLLLKLADKFGFHPQDPKRLFFRISRQDIANMTGTTYETVIRTLSSLEKQKLIQLDNKDILITQLKKLQAEASSPARKQ